MTMQLVLKKASADLLMKSNEDLCAGKGRIRIGMFPFPNRDLSRFNCVLII